jgi:hypothetical protein
LNVEILVWVVLPVLVIGQLAFSGWRDFRKRAKLLHGVARCSIETLVDGARVRVVGHVLPAEELVRAPYSGRLCLAFRSQTVAMVPSPWWMRKRLLHDRSKPNERAIEFRVRDDTGEIAVDPGHFRLALVDAMIPEAEATRHGPMVTSSSGHTEYHESVLLERQQVAVTGLVRRREDGSRYLAGTKGEPLVIATDPDAFVP